METFTQGRGGDWYSGDAAGRERLGLYALDGVEARCITTGLLERASEREIASWQESARA